jgi:hypothetical protein
MKAQQSRANGMKGSHPPKRGVIAEQMRDALAHFPGGLVGERHRQDLMGPETMLQYQPGDFVGQHPGFAATGPRQHDLRAGGVHHGFQLGGVQEVPERNFAQFGALGGRGKGSFHEINGSKGDFGP